MEIDHKGMYEEILGKWYPLVKDCEPNEVYIYPEVTFEAQAYFAAQLSEAERAAGKKKYTTKVRPVLPPVKYISRLWAIDCETAMPITVINQKDNLPDIALFELMVNELKSLERDVLAVFVGLENAFEPIVQLVEESKLDYMIELNRTSAAYTEHLNKYQDKAFKLPVPMTFRDTHLAFDEAQAFDSTPKRTSMFIFNHGQATNAMVNTLKKEIESLIDELGPDEAIKRLSLNTMLAPCFYKDGDTYVVDYEVMERVFKNNAYNVAITNITYTKSADTLLRIFMMGYNFEYLLKQEILQARIFAANPENQKVIKKMNYDGINVDDISFTCMIFNKLTVSWAERVGMPPEDMEQYLFMPDLEPTEAQKKLLDELQAHINQNGSLDDFTIEEFAAKLAEIANMADDEVPDNFSFSSSKKNDLFSIVDQEKSTPAKKSKSGSCNNKVSFSILDDEDKAKKETAESKEEKPSPKVSLEDLASSSKQKLPKKTTTKTKAKTAKAEDAADTAASDEEGTKAKKSATKRKATPKSATTNSNGRSTDSNPYPEQQAAKKARRSATRHIMEDTVAAKHIKPAKTTRKKATVKDDEQLNNGQTCPS